ncbi:uncharacterized protein LOC143280274 [Babylonia areolata]|uniref:uncharacterized protein LOC143280274 n=1 Tax=Babylonia areolata TaxID=304850 RepID=UPI003FD41588
MTEIYIPTYLVPENTLKQLKEIAQRLQHQAVPDTALPSTCPPAHLDAAPSSNHSPRGTVGQVTSLPPEVTIEAAAECVPDDRAGDSKTHRQTHVHTHCGSAGVDSGGCWSPLAVETRGSGRHGDRTARHVCPCSAVSQTGSPSHQTVQPCGRSSKHERTEHYLRSESGLKNEGEQFLLKTPSQSMPPAEDSSRKHDTSPSKLFQKISMFDSADDAVGMLESSAESFPPAPPLPNHPLSSAKNEAVRVFPPRFGSSSEQIGPRSPALLTPPKTPEGERKRGVPEVFTFDDLACTQERFRQMVERLQQLHEQHVRHPGRSTPGHPSSLPGTPTHTHPHHPTSAPPFPSRTPSTSSSLHWPPPPSCLREQGFLNYRRLTMFPGPLPQLHGLFKGLVCSDRQLQRRPDHHRHVSKV